MLLFGKYEIDVSNICFMTSDNINLTFQGFTKKEIDASELDIRKFMSKSKKDVDKSTKRRKIIYSDSDDEEPRIEVTATKKKSSQIKKPVKPEAFFENLDSKKETKSKVSPNKKTKQKQTESLTITKPKPESNQDVNDMESTSDKKSKVQTESSPIIPKPKLQSKEDVNDGEDTTDDKKISTSKSSFNQYLKREGPKNLGSKEIPKGQENCLEGLIFVLTGVFECIEREEAKHLIERYSGKVTSAVSKKTTYVVAGREPGLSKIQKAKSNKTKIIDEDALFNLISSLPAKNSKYEEGIIDSLVNATPKKAKREGSVHDASDDVKRANVSQTRKSIDRDTNELLVDKYKPVALSQVIGQKGEKSGANKLKHWLKNWFMSRSGNSLVNKEDGSVFLAALLSGPPGVGKTTSALLASQETGFTYSHYNASDCRSKSFILEHVKEGCSSHTLQNYLQDKEVDRKHLIIMDEIDGIAGNQDRGGMQEIISLIKKSKVPIICICNDRNSQKIKSLANYCYDLRFYKPRVEQLKAFLCSVIFKEKLHIPLSSVNLIIESCNHDVRQILHNLNMWSVSDKTFTYDMILSESKASSKDTNKNIFESTRLVFTHGDHKKSYNEMANLFFVDYSFMPLFCQENYLLSQPSSLKNDSKGGQRMNLFSKAADSFSLYDICDSLLRKRNNWSLLPTQSVFSVIIPGQTLEGYLSGMINFPSFFGKNSTKNKNKRLIEDLSLHTSLTTLCNKESFNLDYSFYLKELLLFPLINAKGEGIKGALSLMEEYNLSKTDFDSLFELNAWKNEVNSFTKIDSKVKSSLTREYNKNAHFLPYTINSIGGKQVKKKNSDNDLHKDADDDDDDQDFDNAPSDEEEEEIKQVTKKSKDTKPKGKAASSTSKNKKQKIK